jgi:hypothetical protein
MAKMARFDAETVFAVKLIGHAVSKTSKGFEILKKAVEIDLNDAALGSATAGSEKQKKLQAKRIELHREHERLKEELDAIATAERQTVQAHFDELREKEKFEQFDKDIESTVNRYRGLIALLESVPDTSIDAKFVISVGSQLRYTKDDDPVFDAFAAKIVHLLRTDAVNNVGSDELDQIQQVCHHFYDYKYAGGIRVFENLSTAIDTIKTHRRALITAQKTHLESARAAMKGKSTATDDAAVIDEIKMFIAAGGVPEWTSPASLKKEMDDMETEVAKTAFARLKVSWLYSEVARIEANGATQDDLNFVQFLEQRGTNGEKVTGLDKLESAIRSKLLADKISRVDGFNTAVFAEVAEILGELRPKKASIASFGEAEQKLRENVVAIVQQLKHETADPISLSKEQRTLFIAQIDAVSKFIGEAEPAIASKPQLITSLANTKAALEI